MHICLVSGEYPPENSWGGIATYTYYAAQALTRAGHCVWVVARAAQGAPRCVERDGVTVLRIEPTRAHYYLRRIGLVSGGASRRLVRLEVQLATAYAVRCLERQVGIDVTEYPDSYADGLLHPYLCRSPYVVKLHVPYFLTHQYYTTDMENYIDRAERRFVAHAALVTAPSACVARCAQDVYRLGGTGGRVVPNPLDLDQFRPRQEEVRKDPTRPMVLYLGWLSRGKGVHLLVDAVPIVASELPGARFVLLGGDAEEREGREPLREQLGRKLATAGCEQQVKFLDFVRDRNEVVRWYQAADVCVFPSLWDNLPYTVMEAMACGCPVVASAVGGISEMIEDGISGLLVPPGDVTALANALIRLLGDPVLRRALGGNARLRAERLYGLCTVGKQMTDLYTEVVAAHRY